MSICGASQLFFSRKAVQARYFGRLIRDRFEFDRQLSRLLEVVTSEMAPAAAVARNAAIANSASLVSVMSRKSASPVVK